MNNKVRFIRLHASEDNSVCLFNVEEILCVYVEDGETVVVTYTDEEEINVKESVDKINNYLHDGFVKCHSSEDNTPMLFNVNHIIRCLSDDGTTTVCMHADCEYEVNESVERIYNGIMNPQPQNANKKKPSKKNNGTDTGPE